MDKSRLAKEHGEINKSQLVIGISLVVLGVLIFLERGYFASVFLHANNLGNMGWNSGDAEKIQIFAIGGGIGVIVGILFSITAVV